MIVIQVSINYIVVYWISHIISYTVTCIYSTWGFLAWGRWEPLNRSGYSSSGFQSYSKLKFELPRTSLNTIDSIRKSLRTTFILRKASWYGIKWTWSTIGCKLRTIFYSTYDIPVYYSEQKWLHSITQYWASIINWKWLHLYFLQTLPFLHECTRSRTRSFDNFKVQEY